MGATDRCLSVLGYKIPTMIGVAGSAGDSARSGDAVLGLDAHGDVSRRW